MRLIVGLGNPDPEYQWTPHNLGFMVVDELANRHGIRVGRPEGQALVGRGQVAGEDVALAKPQTYMNLSGNSVRELLAKYELDGWRFVVGPRLMNIPIKTTTTAKHAVESDCFSARRSMKESAKTNGSINACGRSSAVSSPDLARLSNASRLAQVFKAAIRIDPLVLGERK